MINRTQFNDGANELLNQALCECKDVYQGGIAKSNEPKARLTLKEAAQTKFFPASASRFKVESELQHLEEEGILTQVQTFDWATPIVPGEKHKNKIRI